MFLRILGLLMSLMMALLPALGLAETTFTMAGFDGEDSTRDWTTNGFFTRMEARTGVNFTFQQYNARETWQAAKNAMFADGAEMPDVLFKAALTTDELIRYTDSGKLIDLLPLLEENAPNLWAILQEHPDWLKAITLPNGKVGALPAIQELPPQNVMWINTNWLQELKLEMPTDMESLRKVLTAFRDRDPNLNGKKDEIPMLFMGPWELKFFSHAWGVVANDYNIYLDDAGKVQYWPQEDSFFAMAETLRGMFADGLLDPDGFITADSMRRITKNDAEITYGAFFAPSPVALLSYTEGAENYSVMGPFEFEGKQIYRDLIGNINRGTFAITSACEDPAALLKWVDVLYTEDGAIAAMAGEENENYYFREDGSWDWVGGAEGLGIAGLNELTIYDTGDMPWMFPLDFNNRYLENAVGRMNNELAKLNSFAVQPFPTYTLTNEETAYVGQLQMELGRYVDEMLARMVLGEVPINEETKAEFMNGLEERGVNDMIAFWQEIATR